MNLEQFIEKLPDNFSSLDLELIEKAYRYAEEAHKGQTLASGLPHISHCASVAAILAELSVPPELIITGLLHDSIEDTDITLRSTQRSDIGQWFATYLSLRICCCNIGRAICAARIDYHRVAAR